jgi:hypothetical protein
VTDCSFQISSEHSTSLGRVRYQHCVCGRFRLLLNSEVLAEGPARGSPRKPHSRTTHLSAV